MNSDLRSSSSAHDRAWLRFRRNRRGWVSLWLFLVLFGVSLAAELLSNDRPLLIYYNGEFYAPLLVSYPETTFGGDFESEADYLDPYLMEKLTAGENWVLYPLNRYHYDTINYQSRHAHPAPPTAENTGSAPMIAGAMCWRGSSMAFGSR